MMTVLSPCLFAGVKIGIAPSLYGKSRGIAIWDFKKPVSSAIAGESAQKATSEIMRIAQKFFEFFDNFIQNSTLHFGRRWNSI
ncbi:MAG: hypothetical protein V8T29_02615 [Oscillospiraceae bacterium]|jgi:hypothetical protein